MTKSSFDIRPPVLRGRRESGALQVYADSMQHEIDSCSTPFPKQSLIMVTKDSPISYKKAVENVGVYFIRELRYDFRLFTAAEYSERHHHSSAKSTSDANTRSFLWYDSNEGTPGHWETFGGCTFRLKRDTWFLTWIWLHPYMRRRGHLKKAWPFFRSMFGIFFPEEPISNDLVRFMQKIGYDKVLMEEAKRRKATVGRSQ